MDNVDESGSGYQSNAEEQEDGEDEPEDDPSSEEQEDGEDNPEDDSSSEEGDYSNEDMEEFTDDGVDLQQEEEEEPDIDDRSPDLEAEPLIPNSSYFKTQNPQRISRIIRNLLSPLPEDNTKAFREANRVIYLDVCLILGLESRTMSKGSLHDRVVTAVSKLLSIIYLPAKTNSLYFRSIMI